MNIMILPFPSLHRVINNHLLYNGWTLFRCFCHLLFTGLCASPLRGGEKKTGPGICGGPVDTLSVLTWLRLWQSLDHIPAAFHSGVCISLVSSWGLGDSEADHDCARMVAHILTDTFFLHLSPCFVSSSTLCHLWVLGFISQIDYLNPSLCLSIFFWGTQTKTIIYYGQQIAHAPPSPLQCSWQTCILTMASSHWIWKTS